MALDATMRGISIEPLFPNDEGEGGEGGAMLMVFADGHLGDTPTLGTTCHIVSQRPLWGPIRTFQGAKGPIISLASGVAGRLDVTVAAYSGTPSDLGAYATSIEAVIIRYSSVGYPLDPDGIDERSSTSLKDRTEWHGASATYQKTGLTTGTRYYVTAWTVTRVGISNPSFASFTVS